MKEIANKLSTGNNLRLESHLIQSPFTIAHVDCLVNIVRMQKFKETGGWNYIIYSNKLYKTCFAHDSAYADGNDLAKGTISQNVLKNRAYEIKEDSSIELKENWWVCCIYILLQK